MDLTKILEKKGLEASGSESTLIENYKRTHPADLVNFMGHTIPYCEYQALEEIIEKYELHISNVGFDDGHVTYLDLASEGIKSIDEIPCLELLANLQRIYLYNNEITEIKGLESLTNLQALYLYDNQITEIKGLENLANLQTLYLSRNKITEIKNLENLTNLKKLDLGYNNLNKKKSKKLIKSLRKKGVDVRWT